MKILTLQTKVVGYHMRRIITTLYICCITIFSLSSQTPVPLIPEAPKYETRAVWLTTFNSLDWPKTKATTKSGIEKQKEELCDILNHLKALNINTVLLQTRVRATTIYPSAIEPWDGSLTGSIGKSPGYDPLQFAIEECHKRGMELHAWVVTIPCFKTNVANKMGTKSVLKNKRNICVRHHDSWYLDPGHPQTAIYLASICKEITENYDIDGIHLDYIRYPENAKRFNDHVSYRLYGKKKNKSQWRRENITHCVRTIYQTVKAIKPWVKVSSAPVGKFNNLTRYSSYNWNAYSAVYQDAQGWLREGIQDMLFPMMYFQGNHFYPFAIDWKENEYDGYVAPGLGIYFLSPKEKDWDLSVITRELSFTRTIGMGGQAYFRYAFLKENHKGICDFLKYDFYPYPALPQPCKRTENNPPNAPKELKKQMETSGTVLSWSPVDNANKNGIRYNVYASKTSPVCTDSARHLIATNLQDCYYPINDVYAIVHGYHFAVTAIDRFGNESTATPLVVTEGEQTMAAPDFLKHDSQYLYLPEQEHPYVAFTDIFGRIISVVPYREKISIKKLPKGLYQVRTLGKKGRTFKIGSFIK